MKDRDRLENAQIKTELRKKYRILRDEYNAKDADDAIFNRIISDDRFKKAQTIMTYVSMGSEVDTLQIIKYALANGKRVAVPVVVRGTRQMEISYITSLNDLEQGSYEILEPKKAVFKKCPICDVDLIIVPGICFDRKGHRIGYGAGFYDRMLAHACAFTMGICYEICMVEDCHPEPYDIPVNCIVTEERTLNICKIQI